jgi:hypothetical protein
VNNGSGVVASATVHAGSDEDHLGVAENVLDVLPRLIGGGAALLRVAASAEALGDPLAYADAVSRVAASESLRVGVDADEVDSADAGFDHAVDGVAAATSNADDFNRR